MTRWAWVALLFTGCATTTGQEQTERQAEALMRQAAPIAGDLELHCTPDDAEVSLDGVPQGACRDFDGDPRRLKVGDGLHRVDVTKSGFYSYQTYYQPSGARAVLTIELLPQANPEGEAP